MIRLCIDLGATAVKGALVEDGQIRNTAKTPTMHDSREGIVRSLSDTIGALICPEVQAVCIASAGDIDEKTRTCVSATGNLQGFTGFDFAEFVRERYSLPCFAANDAYCALLGEMKYGAGRSFPSARVAMLTLGSGVGGAYFDGARMRPEASNSQKLGHFILHENGTPCNCGKRGCIEQYLSGRAINRLARANGLESDGLFSAYREGDPAAVQIVKEVGEELALAAEIIDERFPFEVLLLGGGVAESVGESLPALQHVCKRRLALAALGNSAGILGAYALAEEGSGL